MGVRAGDFKGLHNPVWISADNLRDSSVRKTADGYHLFYSRLSASQVGWGNPPNWHIAKVVAKDFVTFTNNRNVSPGGCASSGDVVRWQGRWLLPYQTYPATPSQLVDSESPDLKKSRRTSSRQNFQHMPCTAHCFSHREMRSAA